MKQKLVVLVSILSIYSLFSQDVNVSQVTTCYENLMFCEPACGINRTFMYTHPIYRNVGAQLFMWHNAIFNHNSCNEYSFQIMPMHEESFKDNGKAARYFLMNDKSFLTVKGDNIVTNTLARDIRAEWLGLSGNFNGGFTVKPFQRQTAVWAEAKMNVRTCINSDMFNRLWVAVAVPFHRVENDLSIVETVTAEDPLFPKNITQALSNPTLLYQKFGPRKTLTGVGEILFKFGTNFLDYEGFQIGTYSMFVAPAAGANKSEFVFSPFLGNNSHWGSGLGVIMQFPLSCNCRYLASFFFEGETIYLLRNFQHRTYDLKFKPWSRYILLANKDGRINVPATNVFTVKSRVRPYNVADLSWGFRWEHCNGFHGEISYNLWLRGRERVKPHKCLPKGWGIQGVGFFPGTTIPRTADTSTIQFQGPNDVDPETGDPVFLEIDVNRIRLESAAAKGSINHRGQIALGYEGCAGTTHIFAGAGAFVEYAQFDSDLKRWGVFAKFGMNI